MTELPEPREDLVAAHLRALERVAMPGTWWTGAERVAIAAAARAAWDCELCQRRKSALTPFAIDGEHAPSLGELNGELNDVLNDVLNDATVDTVHRLVTDPARLSKNFLEERLGNEDFTVEEYVELIGVVTQIVSVDTFHYGLDLPLLPLPEPTDGEPTRRRPSGAAMDGAWVPMVPSKRLDPEDADLYGDGPRVGNVIRALSLVPDEVRALRDLSAAQYLGMSEIMRFGTDFRAISRAQMELVAARVSSLNECFY